MPNIKNIIFITAFSLLIHPAHGQKNIDSLKNITDQQKNDSNEVKALLNLSSILSDQNLIDSSTVLMQKALLLSSKIDYQKGKAEALLQLGRILTNLGSYSLSISFLFKALHVYEQMKDDDGITAAQMVLQGTYREAGDYKNSLAHAFRAKQRVEKNDSKANIIRKGMPMLPFIFGEIGETYQYMNELDLAEFYAQKAIGEHLLFNGATWNFPFYLLGKIRLKQGRYNEALQSFRTAVPLAIKNGVLKDTLDIYNSITELYRQTGNSDSAIYYGKKITDKWNSISNVKILLRAATTLADVYKLKKNTDSALRYFELKNALNDSIYSIEKQREFQSLTFNEQLRQQESEQQQQKLRNKITIYALIAGLLVFFAIALILYRNNLHKQKAKRRIEEAYKELKATQAQLIQSEKMASLGELTAGIAHEIQNPLNFVNNFSEVNKELIDELQAERNKVTRDFKTEDELLSDIKENEQKINHHGKRADAIVKGMLQHSRTSTGQKEPTDINALADEYLRLAYHGLRAKDKSLNAVTKTDFDNSIGKINIIPQDIGRVILNLINNAFYAVSAKAIESGALRGNEATADSRYEPNVSVSTKKNNGKVEIKVSDNGNGIPQKVLDKIFQPFFTTKPTGEGTGLGLSLAYDIVKAHGGEIKVDTKEGKGSEFVIQLPLKENHS